MEGRIALCKEASRLVFCKKVFEELAAPIIDIVAEGQSLIAVNGPVKSGKSTTFKALSEKQYLEDSSIKWVYWDLIRHGARTREEFWKRFASQLGLNENDLISLSTKSIDEIAEDLSFHIGVFLSEKNLERIVVVVDNWDTAQAEYEISSSDLANLVEAVPYVRGEQNESILAFIGVTRFPSKETFLAWGRNKKAQGHSNFERLSGTIDRMGVMYDFPHLTMKTAKHFAEELGCPSDVAEKVAGYSGGWVGLIAENGGTSRFDMEHQEKLCSTLKNYLAMRALPAVAVTLDINPTPGNIVSTINKAIHRGETLGLPKNGKGFAPVVTHALGGKKYLVIDSENLYNAYGGKRWDQFKKENQLFVDTIIPSGSISSVQEPFHFSQIELRRFVDTMIMDYAGEDCVVVVVGRTHTRINKIFGPNTWEHIVSQPNPVHKHKPSDEKDGLDDHMGTAFMVNKHTEEPMSRLFIVSADKDWTHVPRNFHIPNVTILWPYGKSSVDIPSGWVRHENLISKVVPPIPDPPKGDSRPQNGRPQIGKVSTQKVVSSVEKTKYLIVDFSELYFPYASKWEEFKKAHPDYTTSILGEAAVTGSAFEEELYLGQEDEMAEFFDVEIGRFIRGLAQNKEIDEENIYIFGDRYLVGKNFDIATSDWLVIEAKQDHNEEIADFVFKKRTENKYATFSIVSSSEQLMGKLKQANVPSITMFHPFDLPQEDGYRELKWERHGKKIAKFGIPLPPINKLDG